MERRGKKEIVPQMGDFEQGEVDLDAIMAEPELQEITPPQKQQVFMQNTVQQPIGKNLVNCLRNETVIVRRLPKRTSLVRDANHILSDGMHANAFRMYSVPKMQKSNTFVNVLTNAEKDYLEFVMGLEPNALSIYRQPAESNFWSNANPSGLSFVKLTKGDNIFNLSVPTDYISLKILLANKDKICPSMEEYQARPKETYEYVVIREGDESKKARSETDATIQAFISLGKISEDKEVLKLVVETMMGKKYADSTTTEWLQTQASDLVRGSAKNAKLFLSLVEDELLDIKVLIRKCLNAGIIADRGGYLYIRESNTPMCGDNQNPTADIAARWLSLPKNQDILFSLQAKVK